MVAAPFIISLKASNQSIVRGCPGVPNTCPRLEGTIEIRSRDTTLFTIRAVTFEFDTTQTVAPSSGFVGSDISRTYNLHRNGTAYTPPAGLLHEETLGMDIPFIIPLPKEVISSGKFSRFHACTTHSLRVTAAWGTKDDLCTSEFPVAIKKYDTLPVFRQFNEPITQTVQSSDKLTTIEYSVPNTAIGPNEEMLIYVKVMANPRKALSELRSKFTASDKIRLRLLKFSLNEILECHDGGLPASRSTRIATVTRETNEQVVDPTGVMHNLRLAFPFGESEARPVSPVKPGAALHHHAAPQPQSAHDPSLPSYPIPAPSLVPDTSTEIAVPLSLSRGFTSVGRLFSMRYEVVLKLRFSHAKDQEVTLPITVSPYDRIASAGLLKWIFHEWEACIKQFGTLEGLSEGERARRFAVNPPVLYRPHNAQDWVRLGLSEKYMGRKGKGGGIVHYIE